VFLEPYSYDHNPIELVFHSAKDYCRKNYPSGNSNDPIATHFKEALFNCVSGDTACNYFAHCHVHVTPEERIKAINN
jgi:hypothetical protein